jgi:hypothetical protein
MASFNRRFLRNAWDLWHRGTRSGPGRGARDAFPRLTKTRAKQAVSFWDCLGGRLIQTAYAAR